MTDSLPSVIVLPGAGGEVPDRAIFAADEDDTTCFHAIGYPGWQRYIAGDFSAEALVADLAAQIVAKVPHGPIYIVGISFGGHFGYAIALRLRAQGREIGGLCAIDTFMVGLSAASVGSRAVGALGRGLAFLRKWQIGEFTRLARSLFWRVLFRQPNFLRVFCARRRLSSVLALDPFFARELSMRLLIRAATPWIASLDREPISLTVPVVLIRTRLIADDDAAWRRRCPDVEIFETTGEHLTLFEPENLGSFRAAFLAGTRSWRGGNRQRAQARDPLIAPAR
jgi:thioesterase domain-containing protein